MNRKPYPSGLTGEQWDILFPLLPPAKPGGRPRTVDLREVVNGEVTFTEGTVCTGATPGKLLRSYDMVSR